MDRFLTRDGYVVEVAPIEKVEMYEDGGCAITRGEPGWGTFGLSAEELNGFEPKVGDTVIMYSYGLSSVRGVIIEDKVLRFTSGAQAAKDHAQWRKNWRLEKLERYIEHGEALKSRADALPEALRLRMARFTAKEGVEFWIEDAPYEMAIMEGAAALLRKVQELGYIADVDDPTHEGNDTEGAVEWIEDWWDINSAKHDPPYDYKKQMALVPDFGDGHSGNTAGAAYAFAKAVLNGKEV